MKAGTRIGAALVSVLAIGAIAAIPAGASPGAGPAAKSGCSLSQDEINGGLGASYVYSLNVRNLSCDRAKTLVVKFHQCRHDHGGRRGHCNGVKGYQCDEKKGDSSPTLYQASAKCVKGSKKFAQTFGELI